MRNFFRPAEAPYWLSDVLNSIRGALSDVWATALRLKDYTTAGLPPAADWKQGIVYDSTLPAVKFSDGTNWVRLQNQDADLDAIAALTATGLLARTGAGTYATRTLTAPAAGFTITNPAGIAGEPTFVLANDLGALEALTGTNTIYYRSGVDTWSAVTIGGNLSFSAGTLSVTSAALTKTDDTNVTLTLGGSPTTALLAATSLTLGWTGQLAATRGGTGFGSYAVGDILYASTTTALSKLADVATGNALISGGIGVAPSWGKIGLTTHISGTLAVGNGGTGTTTSTGTGSVVLSASPTLTGTLTAATANFSAQVSATGTAGTVAAFSARRGAGAGVDTGAANANNRQIEFGYNGTNDFRHAITTEHNTGTNVGNVLEIWLHRGVSQAAGDVPNYKALTVSFLGLNVTGAFQIAGTQVVGARATGWGAPTGTATRTTFATSTVTTSELAERVKALIDDLTTHGLIGT